MGEQTPTIPAFFFLILFLFQVVTPSQGQLRLQNGGSNYGRLEILYNGEWGTICDDNFGIEDARVACRELGLDTSVVNAFQGARYGEGTGTIWLDEVGCFGFESTIDSCAHNAYGNNDCSHSEDVGISCGSSNDSTGSLRLVDGGSNYGRLEVTFNGVWGTVCDDGFDHAAARVACRQLGLDTVTVDYYPGAKFGQGTGPIALDEVNCIGSESSLDYCTHNAYGDNDCSHSEDVGISCGATNVSGSSSPASGVGSWIGGAIFIVVICVVAVMIRRRRMYAMRQRRSTTTTIVQAPVTTTVHVTSNTNAPGTTPMYQHTPAQQQQPGGPRPYPTQPFTPTYPPAPTGGAPPANPYPVQAYLPAMQHPAQPPVQPPPGVAPYPPQQAGAAPYPPQPVKGAAPYPPQPATGAAPYPPPSTAGAAPYPPQQPVEASAPYPPQSSNVPEGDLPPPPSYDDIVKK